MILSRAARAAAFLRRTSSHVRRQVLGSSLKVTTQEPYWPAKHSELHGANLHILRESDAGKEEKLDPFCLVADELASLGNRLRSMVSTEVPKLASAAEYFFKAGVEGKRFRPMVLLLMASSMTIVLPEIGGVFEEQRFRQQKIAEITEMIHVASLLHDDVLDSAETRRGIGSLNFVMGNKGIVTAPLLFALDQQPQLNDLIERGFKNTGDVELAVELLKKTDGIQKTRQLASEHASWAAAAINSLPPCHSERAINCRRALVDITEKVLSRTK